MRTFNTLELHSELEHLLLEVKGVFAMQKKVP